MVRDLILKGVLGSHKFSTLLQPYARSDVLEIDGVDPVGGTSPCCISAECSLHRAPACSNLHDIQGGCFVSPSNNYLEGVDNPCKPHDNKTHPHC